ncbi:hypothetical protein EMCRGX_G013657 [Ephydatia muelleri]
MKKGGFFSPKSFSGKMELLALCSKCKGQKIAYEFLSEEGIVLSWVSVRLFRNNTPWSVESPYATVSDIILATPCFDKAPSANATPCSSHKTPENSLDIQLRNEEFYKKLSEASPKA